MEKWIIKEFGGNHNHPLVDAIDTLILQSYCTISNPDKAQLHAMHKVGIKTSQIMDYIVQQRGYENISVTSKDLYNHVDAMRKFEI